MPPRRHRPSDSRQAGHSLVELALVLVLMAALGAIAVGAGRHAVMYGHEARARAEMEVVAAALEQYRATAGDYPRSGSGAALLQSLLGRRGPLDEPFAVTPFLDLSRFQVSADPYTSPDAVLLDPWGQPYQYAYRTRPDWSNPRFILFSAGADGVVSSPLSSGGFLDPDPSSRGDDIHPDN